MIPVKNKFADKDMILMVGRGEIEDVAFERCF
jgi:hypothetical protein